MSTTFVIPNVETSKLLQVMQDDDDLIVIDDGDHYVIEMPADREYALQKRMFLARAANIPGDEVQQGSNTASVFLLKTTSVHCWFVGYAISVRHPEIVLNRLVELLAQRGIDTKWLSEHHREIDDYYDES